MTSAPVRPLGSLLDGAERQEAARSLWDAWRRDRRPASVVQGISGVGKSAQLVRPLVDRHRQEGGLALSVDVPKDPTDAPLEVLGLIGEELADRADLPPRLADLMRQGDAFGAIEVLLAAGDLVVLDEFQRLLDPAGTPIEPFATKLPKLLARGGLPGCLWLVTNRAVDAGWTLPFHRVELNAPGVEDAERIVLSELDIARADELFPPRRRLEVCRRLGTNPRALTLLGRLLSIYHLDELLGAAADVPEAPAEARFVDDIERALLRKAQEGLDDDALDLLDHLAVVPGSAPRVLLRHLTGSETGVRTALGPLRGRYLVETRAGNRFAAHPLVREVAAARLREDDERWRAVHRSIGAWHADGLADAGRSTMPEAALALAIAGARFHFTEADDPRALSAALRPAYGYLERSYGWVTPQPATPEQRDARITLLEAYAEREDTPAVIYCLARMRHLRNGPGDAARALDLAERATRGQDFSAPWVLLIVVTQQVLGLEAAIATARRAAEHVAPDKSLHSIYQLLGNCLTQLGRPEEAVTAQLAGADCALGGAERLVEAAMYIAAGEDDQLLLRVQQWTGQRLDRFGLQADLGEVLALECADRWRDAAEHAGQARQRNPRYLALFIHEILSWLGAGEPQRARYTFDSFPLAVRIEPRNGLTWLAAVVHVENGDVAAGRRLLGAFLDEDASAEDDLRGRLLHEWDHRLGATGIATPSYTCPILPPTVTGLSTPVRRPLYGGPVLPRQPTRTSVLATRRTVLVVATEWRSKHGGLSTFNRRMCAALAAAGARVYCQVLTASPEERADAAARGVELIVPPLSSGLLDPAALGRKPRLDPSVVPDLVIGHGRVTGPAAVTLAEDHFPRARRIHVVHMAPDEIEWDKVGRTDDPGERAEERTAVEVALGRSAHRLAAVGPRLYDRYVTELSAFDAAGEVVRLDPGFDGPSTPPRRPPPGSPWRVLVFGRTDDARLKGLDLAAAGVGAAVRERGDALTAVEFVVRGAPPGTSEALRRQVREWSGQPALAVVVRPYTVNSESLTLDLRRASLALMPSRSEGFGLVGVEAIVAGTPVLISADSGLGQLLREVLPADDASRFVVPMAGDDERDADSWGRAVVAVLRDRDAAFARAEELRQNLARRCSWAAMAETLLETTALSGG